MTKTHLRSWWRTTYYQSWYLSRAQKSVSSSSTIFKVGKFLLCFLVFFILPMRLTYSIILFYFKEKSFWIAKLCLPEAKIRKTTKYHWQRNWVGGRKREAGRVIPVMRAQWMVGLITLSCLSAAHGGTAVLEQCQDIATRWRRPVDQTPLTDSWRVPSLTSSNTVSNSFGLHYIVNTDRQRGRHKNRPAEWYKRERECSNFPTLKRSGDRTFLL